jgi:hypothetical protein
MNLQYFVSLISTPLAHISSFLKQSGFKGTTRFYLIIWTTNAIGNTGAVYISTPILAGLHKKTCSRHCANINRAGITYGIGSPNDKVKSGRALKARLLQERGNVCERCGYERYEILQIHHKNRDRNDNDLGNLELICPNCHCEEHFIK